MSITITGAFHQQNTARWICSSCLAHERRTLPFAHLKRGSVQRRTVKQNAAQRDGKLPDYPARTRFAPSPTGTMHIGGLRTALYSYLLAKRTGGQFLLRIEDTDQKRFVPGSTERLCSDLQWAGVQWDEGPDVGGPYGPYQQSHRTDIYQQHAKTLLDQSKAYRCFCPQVADSSGETSFVTSGCYQDCSSLSKDESDEKAHQCTPHTVRLMPATASSPSRGKIPDLIFGKIQSNIKRGHIGATDGGAGLKSNAILLKSDGTPTYHFANVVDDHLMKITHVIRGTEWMASTPLHCDLYDAFGWQPPLFAHVPLLVDKTQAKLSKRNADLVLDVQGMKENSDVLPETLVNFLALQGWSNPIRNDVMDMNELMQKFDLKFTTGNVVVAMEKLWFLQAQHVARRCEEARTTNDDKPIHELVQKIVTKVPTEHLTQQQRDNLFNFCSALLLFDPKGFKDTSQFIDRNRYMFVIQKEVPTLDVSELQAAKINELVGKIVEAAMLEQVSGDVPAENAAAATTSTMGYFNELESLSKTMHRIVVETIWVHGVGVSRDDNLLSALNRSEDAKTIALLLSKDVTEAAELLEKYQALQKPVMKRLRQVLCYGNPGPSIGIVMALLGAPGCWTRYTIATMPPGTIHPAA